MLRFIIYLFPAVINCILCGVFFFTSDFFSRNGAPELLIGATMATWAIIYMSISFVLGKVVTAQNCAKLISLGCFLLAIASAGFWLYPGYYLQFFWLALTGSGSALYCTPCQLFMKNIEPNQNSGVVRPTALYTASWSYGMACGSFIIAALGKEKAFMFNTIFSLLLAIVVLILDKMPPLKAPEKKSDEQELDYSKYPNCTVAGWILGSLGTLGVVIIRTFAPHRAHDLGLTETQAAYVIALFNTTQGTIALLLTRGKTWMYKPFSAVLMGMCGIVGRILFALGTSLYTQYTAAAIFGLFSGSFYFCYVFYVLARPDSAGYIAVNEILVGVMSIIGPLFAALLVSFGKSSALPFYAGAGLAAAGMLIHGFMVRNRMKRYQPE